jgi:hypothetical protein
MKPPNEAEEAAEAVEALKLLCEHLDVAGLSDEDRKTMARWWITFEMGEPKEFSLGEAVSGLAFPLFDPNTLGVEPRLVPCAMAFKAFAMVIEQGVPGAEHIAEGFLRDCGFNEAEIQNILQEMVSRAPLPSPETLN